MILPYTLYSTPVLPGADAVRRRLITPKLEYEQYHSFGRYLGVAKGFMMTWYIHTRYLVVLRFVCRHIPFAEA